MLPAWMLVFDLTEQGIAVGFALYILLAIPLAAALVARPVMMRFPRAGGMALGLVPAGLMIAFAALGASGPQAASIEWVPSLGVSLSLRLDGFSLLFALLITGIGALVVFYAAAYFAQAPRRTAGNFITLIFAFMAAMLGTVLSDNLILAYVFWEATSLISYLLIGFPSEDAKARKAALQSLIVTAGGGLALFAGILLIGRVLGTYDLSQIATLGPELAASPLAPAILFLFLIGAFTKSAQFPFHFWLPNAMAAPTPASAYLHSATMVKLGVYLLARLDIPFSAMPAFGPILIIVGAVTLLVAVLRALTQGGFKAILAHSTVGSLGLLVLLIGLDGPVASLAVVLFILAHALYKAALFFCAGTAIHATHAADIAAMRGLARPLPWTAAACALAAASMCGLPLLITFLAKETIFEALLDGGAHALLVAAVVLGNAGFVMIGLTAAVRPFLAGYGQPSHTHHRETSGLVFGPMVLSVAGLVLGVAPGLAAPLVASATSALIGVEFSFAPVLWHGVTPVLGLSLLVLGLGIALFVAWPRAVMILGRRRSVDRLLGDAGYNALFDGTLALARCATRILQNGDQRRATGIVILAVIAIAAGTLLFSGTAPRLDTSMGELRILPTAILALMLAGGLAAVLTRSLIVSIVAMGMIGFGSAILFLVNGAPDLALTQFSVEVLVVLILTALLLRAPIRVCATRSSGERRFDAVLAGGFALLVFLALAALPLSPLDLSLSQFYGKVSYEAAFGRNVVNVILVDFRALDTMGEIAVIGFAAIGVWGMLRRRTASRKGPAR